MKIAGEQDAVRPVGIDDQPVQPLLLQELKSLIQLRYDLHPWFSPHLRNLYSLFLLRMYGLIPPLSRMAMMNSGNPLALIFAPVVRFSNLSGPHIHPDTVPHPDLLHLFSDLKDGEA